jgi:hypothetical protein
MLFLALIFSLTSLAQPSSWEIDRLQNLFQDPSIFGGSANDPASPMTQYTVGIGTADSILCTGTLIAKNMVLTAGHCLLSPAQHLLGPGPSKAELRAHFFFYVKNKDKWERRHFQSPVTGVATHPIWQQFVGRKKLGNDSLQSPAFGVWQKYQQEAQLFAYDLAIVSLHFDAPFGFRIAKLPKTETQIDPACQYLVSGFGEDSTTTAQERKSFVSKFGRVGIPNLRVEEWGIRLKGNPSVCHGDSGGPLLAVCGADVTVIGIASHRDPTKGSADCEDPKSTSIHANVYRSLEWIVNQLRKNDSAERL